MYEYSRSNAETYGTLGIEGTTYEPGFKEARRIFGDLTGKTALDFGAGAGRTAQLFLTMGALKVVGVDHDQTMVAEAKELADSRLEFLKIDTDLPFDAETFDVALAAHVFVEVSTIAQMEQISREVYRVMKPGGVFVIIANNSRAIGKNYLSFGYAPQTKLSSGDKISVTIKKGERSFIIDDYFWMEEDYQRTLETAGFEVSMTFPVADGPGWLDESTVAPHVVIAATKSAEMVNK